jgi:hypothetical protein
MLRAARSVVRTLVGDSDGTMTETAPRRERTATTETTVPPPPPEDLGGFVKKQLQRHLNNGNARVTSITAPPPPPRTEGRHSGVTVELSVKQLSSPVFLFIKTVAGMLGENRLDTLLDLHVLSKVKRDAPLPLAVASPVFMSGILSAADHLRKLCDAYDLRLFCDENEIVSSTDHPLFVPFAALTASMILNNQLRRPSNLTSVRGKTQCKIDFIQELREFEKTVCSLYQ